MGFEAAAPMVILKAHHALEKHVLTKWQLSWKDHIAQLLWQLAARRADTRPGNA